MGWYQEGARIDVEPEISFTFVGDVFFDRFIRERYSESYLDVIDQLGDRVLWGSDAVIGNLEGPITTAPTIVKDNTSPSFIS